MTQSNAEVVPVCPKCGLPLRRELDGVRVAACINFDYGDSYLLYNSGYDPAYSQLSVGFVNKAWSIKDAIESGKRTFDFLRGTERYKYDLGAEDRSIYTIRIRR